jgi:hypothetical protein
MLLLIEFIKFKKIHSVDPYIKTKFIIENNIIVVLKKLTQY